MREESAIGGRGLRLNRMGVARAASGIGMFGLIGGIVALLLQGDVTALVIIGFLIGTVGLSTWMILAPDDLRELLRGRRTVYGSNSLLISALFAGCFVILYVMAFSAGVSVDMTNAGYYALKSDVRPIIQNLTRPIQITAFYSRQLLGAQQADSPVLRMFVDAAPDRVKLVYYDPDEQPLRARDFGLSAAFGIYVSYVGPDGRPILGPAGTTRMQGDYANQRWVAEAILRLEARGRFKVVFTIGSGELSIDTDATQIRDGLRSVGITVETLDITSLEIPPDTTALVMLAPRFDFTQDTVNRLARYLAGGGKLLLLAEPAYEGSIRFMTAPESPFAVYLWENWGLRPQRNIVFDPVAFVENAYYVRPASYDSNSTLVRKDAAGGIVQPMFSITQSWERAAQPPDGVTSAVLFQTSAAAFGKLNLREVAANPDRAVRQPGDLSGPLSLALVAQNARSGSKLVAIGDADWVRNDQIEAFDGYILWTNLMDWLTNFLERITVNPIAAQLPLSVNTADLNVVSVVTLLLLPGAVLLAGVWVWWRRASR